MIHPGGWIWSTPSAMIWQRKQISKRSIDPARTIFSNVRAYHVQELDCKWRRELCQGTKRSRGMLCFQSFYGRGLVEPKWGEIRFGDCCQRQISGQALRHRLYDLRTQIDYILLCHGQQLGCGNIEQDICYAAARFHTHWRTACSRDTSQEDLSEPDGVQTAGTVLTIM